MSLNLPNDADLSEMIAAMTRMLKTGARMYQHLAQVTINRFGREGEMTVRYGLRAYGQWRGEEMRQAHHALGLETNMLTLTKCWDNASAYIIKDTSHAEGFFSPSDVKVDVHVCPLAEVWKEAGFFHFGHVYCDEIHHAATSTYHPDGNVVIPQNMMKGDDHCHFQFVMPATAQPQNLGEPTELGMKLANYYRSASELEDAWHVLIRSDRLFGLFFYSLASAILTRHGNDVGQDIINEAMRSFGEERGSILRREHLENGIEISVDNFIDNHDLPTKFAWEYNKSFSSTSADLAIDILYTPHDDAWSDYGSSNFSDLFYETSYPAMANGYDPRINATCQSVEIDGRKMMRLSLSSHELLT